jgi:hypothetical protein
MRAFFNHFKISAVIISYRIVAFITVFFPGSRVRKTKLFLGSMALSLMASLAQCSGPAEMSGKAQVPDSLTGKHKTDTIKDKHNVMCYSQPRKDTSTIKKAKPDTVEKIKRSEYYKNVYCYGPVKTK